MSEPTDITPRRLAERYADEPDFKADVDRALGVFHIGSEGLIHAEGECEGCDAARTRGYT